MTFPPQFIYKSKVSPLGTRFVSVGEEPFVLRPPKPTLQSIHVYAPEGWGLDLDQNERSAAMSFDDWLSAAREYRTRFPSASDVPSLPGSVADLPKGTIFVVHRDQPFALVPPAEATGYTAFSHALGPYRGRLVKDPDLSGVMEVSINDWFALADESERKAYADGFRPELALKQPLSPSDFPAGTEFRTKEDEIPFVVLPDGGEFSWAGGHPRKWQEYTASPHVIMSRQATFEEWLSVVEQSIRDPAPRGCV